MPAVRILKKLFRRFFHIFHADFFIQKVQGFKNGILFQAVFVWFSDAKVFFSLGLWIGVGVAVFMAWHIRYSLEDALDMSEGDAPKHMYRMYGIRMAVVLVVFFITAYFEIGSMIGVLLGVMTLKVGAYMQPLLQKIKKKRR